MLKVLIKKQFSEIFRAYFYDAKKNRLRSKGAIAAWFIFFTFVLVGVAGGMFTVLSLSLCGPLTGAGVGWLYFLLMSGVAILLGAFGSVFNTYSGLYLSKDNDLLLSLPIPVKTVIAARLTGVYLMGALYSAVVMLPTLIVYWAVGGLGVSRVVCGLLLFLIVTVLVLLLSCLLGWGAARLSLKLRHKSFTTVLLALLFICAYYFFYFKANLLIRDLIQNAVVYGARIKGASYVLYLFGRIGEGDWLAVLVFAAVSALLFFLIWTGLRRSFLKIVTSGGTVSKVRYTEKAVRPRSAFAALLGKELGRFTASPNYMLNCGLGILMLPVCGVLLLVRGEAVCAVLNRVFGSAADIAMVLLCAVLCLISSMNDMAAPSVSLEGKCLWIPQSLPLHPKTVLRVKAAMQLLLSGLPMLFAAACAAAVVPAALPVKLLLFLTPLLFTVYFTLFNAAIGVKMPILNWTNELAPIKQSGGVLIAIFSNWFLCMAFGGLYLLFGRAMGAAAYLLIWCVLFAAAGLLLLRWLDTRGAALFAAL